MTAKFLASGVAALAAIGAAAVGITPVVAMASTGQGAGGEIEARPLTPAPRPLAPDSDGKYENHDGDYQDNGTFAGGDQPDELLPEKPDQQTLEDLDAKLRQVEEQQKAG